MEDVVITSGVRTAIGKFQGSLADVPASDLGAHVIREAVARAGIAPENVDQVVMGIVGQVAEDADGQVAPRDKGLDQRLLVGQYRASCPTPAALARWQVRLLGQVSASTRI